MKIAVIAHPNSKKTLPAGRQARVEKDLLETFHVYVSEPPLKGKANNAIREALAKHFEVKKSSVMLVSGEKSKNKVFEIII